MKDKVIAILAAHDSLRASDRESFKSYLADVFSQAEQVPVLQSELTNLKAEVAALKTAK